MHPHECSASQSPGARTFPRASGLETSRFRAQSTFRRVQSPRRLRDDCYVACVRGVPSRPPRTYPFAFSLQRSAFSTLRRFLPARHSLGTCPREPAPEWCRDTSNRRLPPILVCFSLPNCTRAHVARIGFRTRIRSIRGARRFTPTNPLQRDRSLSHRVIRSAIAWRPSPLASPVAICTRTLRPLSRTRVISDRRGHFCESRRDALPAFVTRDAFRQSRFERLPPCGVGRPLRDNPSRIPVALEVTPPRSTLAVSFRLCRLVLAFQRARGIPARLASARVVAVPVRG